MAETVRSSRATKFLFVLATVALLPRPAHSYNVLAVFPIPIYSHTQPFIPVLRALAEKGHNITLITPLRQNNLPSGITHLRPIYTYEQFSRFLEDTGFDRFALKGILFAFKYFWGFCSPMSELMASVAKDYLPPPESSKFDLIIIEPFICEETLVALGYIYNAPVVGKHPGPPSALAAFMMGNPTDFSYIPSQRLTYSDRMDFWQRLYNYIVGQFELVYYHVKVLPEHDQAMREVFAEYPELPYIGDMLANISLLMTETHYSVNYPRPYSRNILEIGGVVVNETESLPQDVKDFIDEAEQGFVYMSWGSHMDHSGLLNKVIDIAISLRYLKYRVLFQWSRTRQPLSVPRNVMVKDWFPQSVILAHPKLKLYLCHGGINSIYEAAYHGVPVLGIPLATDQPHNIALLKELGMAEYMKSEDITRDDEDLVRSMESVIADNRYRDNAQKRSDLLKNRPIEMLQEATFWLEQIMRHGGGAHLRPAASSLLWYERAQLDLIAFIIISIAATIFFVTLYIIRACQKPPPPPPSDKENKKKKQ